jgi:predicted transcriptional regulator YheO
MKAKEAVASALQTTTDAAASRNLVQSQQQQQQLVLHMDEEGMVTAAINHRITIMGCSNRQQVP